MDVKLLQRRDFGELLGIPFTFLMQEYKLLLKAVFTFAGPFFVLSIILSYFLGVGAATSMLNTSDPSLLFEMFDATTIASSFLALFVQIVGYTMLSAVVYSYISIYQTHGAGNFDLPEIWELASSRFWAVLGVSIISGLTIGFSFLFFIIPGIYMGVALCLMGFIVVYEKKTAIDSFSRSMELIKNNWWQTLGIFIVIYILISIVNLILSLPSTLLSSTGIMGFTGSGKLIYFLLAMVQTLLGVVTTSIVLLIAPFMYFSYVEEKEAPDLMGRVNEMKPKTEDSNSMGYPNEIKPKTDPTFTFSSEEKIDYSDEDDINRFRR